MSETATYHIPALLEETIDLLDIKPGGTYVDATFGGGGHSRAILKKLGPDGRLFGFDRDLDAMANIPEGDPRFTFVRGDFRFMPNFLDYYGVEKVDGILADLGVSFHHFDIPERGFSFRADAPLDMRMNAKGETTAKGIINSLSAEQLSETLREYTDLKNSRAIAAKIVAAREDGEIATTGQLADLITPLLNPRQYKKELAQVFQALRIATNDEMTALRNLLEAAPQVLRKGGRLAVLTYHSVEDRMVKDFFRNGGFTEEQDTRMLIYGQSKNPWKILTKSPLTASEREVEENPRSRSAKLRVAEYKR